MTRRRSDERTFDLSLARWTATCTSGELLGFAIGGGLGAAAFVAIPDPTTPALAGALLGSCALAGIVEGAILGGIQGAALKRAFPSLPVRTFAGATSLVAAVGWIVGGSPSTLASLTGAAAAHASAEASIAEPSTLGVVLVAAATGAGVGALFGFAQQRVLRRHVEHSVTWIAANAVGWALALPWSYLAGRVAISEMSQWRAVALCASVGAVMGASIALPTWLSIRRMAGDTARGAAHRIRRTTA